MKRISIKNIIIIQSVVLLSGVLLLSRPDADGMAEMKAAPTASLIATTITPTAPTTVAKKTTTNVAVANTSVKHPSVDLSGIDWVALARHMYGRCGEYYNLAIAVGWPAEQWPKISKVMYRESRCNTTSFNRTDPNGGSRGLMQVNGFWCRPNKYTKQGWLQDKGVLSACEDLFMPEVNLRASLHMWLYSQEKNGCGWRPWATSCR